MTFSLSLAFLKTVSHVADLGVELNLRPPPTGLLLLAAAPAASPFAMPLFRNVGSLFDKVGKVSRSFVFFLRKIGIPR